VRTLAPRCVILSSSRVQTWFDRAVRDQRRMATACRAGRPNAWGASCRS
jgi:hypothetical protein